MKKQIIIIVGFILCLLIGYLFQMDRERKLENTNETIAIVLFRDKNHTGAFGAKIKFYIENRIVKTKVRCDCSDLDLEDTVLIEYSLEDNQLVKMKDKYYMKKYK